MPNLKHSNSGACGKCAEIFNRYVGFDSKLRSWFEAFQADHPEAHISCAGRGSAEQEAAKVAGKSKAVFGKSAHNWNCAIDVFVILPEKDIYHKPWFREVLGPKVPSYLKWYGASKETEWDFPHIELTDWRAMKTRGELKLVEAPAKGKTA